MSDQPFGARDDRFHFDLMSDRWWETETSWWSFSIPERKLGGWLYVMARPNIGTVAGGAWVWDDTAHLPWEVLYSTNYTSLRLPRDQDLDDITLPTGVSVRAVEPLQRYQLGFEDEGRLSVALEFDAVMPPFALRNTESSFKHLNHFDQIGRVAGEISIHGERLPVDCHAARDRSWGPRPEHRPKKTSYVTAAGPADGFLAVTDGGAERDAVTYGFVLRDGHAVGIRSGARVVQIDPEHGWISRITMELIDEHGREQLAIGVPVSRIIINRVSMIDVNSLVRWQFDDGTVAWGEDQDLWPVHQWSATRREARRHARGRES
jgi:hypothetical protein